MAFIKVISLPQGAFSAHANIHLCPFPTCVYVDTEYGYSWNSYGIMIIKRKQKKFSSKGVFPFLLISVIILQQSSLTPQSPKGA